MAVAGGVFIFSAVWWWGTAKKGGYLRDNRVCPLLLSVLMPPAVRWYTKYQVAMHCALEVMSSSSGHCELKTAWINCLSPAEYAC